MLRPERLWEQYLGKAYSELRRGSGWWPVQDNPCELEPPWESFDMRTLNQWDCYVHDWEASWEGNLIARLLPGSPILPCGETIALPTYPEYFNDCEDYRVISVAQFPEDDSTIPKAEQMLLALSALRRPAAFELIGMGSQPNFDQEKFREIFAAQNRGEKRRFSEAITDWTEPYIEARFAAHKHDAPLLYRQLLAHYPESAVVLSDGSSLDLMSIVRIDQEATAYGGSAYLDGAYCFPLRCFTKLDPDPLGVAIAAMDHLERDQSAVLQVLFQPASQNWSANFTQAIHNPYANEDYLDKGQVNQVHEKFSSRLFAVSVRLLASSRDVFNHLVGWTEQFAKEPTQAFCVPTADCDDDGEPGTEARSQLAGSVWARCTFRPGMLLNTQELASLVHLPSDSIASDRLRRVKTRTRPADETIDEPTNVVLGENVHRGKTRTARIPSKDRPHCYIAGATGSGKSTLLLNMICQDIEAGRGVGVLDPHGDLVEGVLKRIPPQRADDVIYFDPSDEEFPFALNILEARKSERRRVVAETVMAFERYFPSSWGPRLERILTYTILTLLDAVPGATLADVERMLTKEQFRNEVVAKTSEQRYRDFWQDQFKFFPKNATDPVLNKLQVFLTDPGVRNVVCQRQSAVDFDALLNDGKIFLANLSTGALTEKIAGTFGSFLVTKIVNAAMRRSKMEPGKRRPWHLYVDEFQSFMNVSVGFERILSESRKQGLVLTTANQYVGQLSAVVRQAIVANVGVLIAFRLGIEDAGTIAKDLGDFEAEDILNLKLGQAIARIGISSTAFNLQTFPDPALPLVDSSQRIIDNTRKRYARPQQEVERELGALPTDVNPAKDYESEEPEPSDPFEDDLVN